MLSRPPRWSRALAYAAGLLVAASLHNTGSVAAQAPRPSPPLAAPEALPTQALIPPPSRQVPPEAVAEVARELNCPLCQGYNLQDCPLEVCAQMRDLIAMRLAEGQSKEAIKAAFVADYGPQVLNAPPSRGFFLLAWVLPVLALAAGVLGLGLWMRRGAARPGAGEQAGVESAGLAESGEAAESDGLAQSGGAAESGCAAAPAGSGVSAGRSPRADLPASGGSAAADYVERLERLAAEEDA